MIIILGEFNIVIVDNKELITIYKELYFLKQINYFQLLRISEKVFLKKT